MKIPVIKKIRKEDLGADVPAWVERILSPLNQFIEQVGTAVTGKLTFGDNMAGKTIQLDFVHNAAKEINVNDARKVIGIMPIYVSGDSFDAWTWSQLDNGNISVTLKFVSAPAPTITRTSKILVLF